MRGAAAHPWAEPRSDALPYQIAGPAGSDFASQEQRRVRNESGDTTKRNEKCELRPKSFDVVTWHAMLNEFGHPPYGNALMTSSVAQMKRNGYRNDFSRCSLAVRVERIHFLGKDATVTIADPTGSIVASVLAEVFEGRKTGWEEGAVLMLKDVFTILYPERKATGYHINADHGLHLTIKSENVVRVFGIGEEVNFAFLPLQRAYSDSALVPPNVNHEIMKRQRSAGVLASIGTAHRTSTRDVPLSGPNRASNLPPYRRPTSMNHEGNRGRGNGNSGRRPDSISYGQGGSTRNDGRPAPNYRTLPQGSGHRRNLHQPYRRIEASIQQQVSNSASRKRPPIQPLLPPRSAQRHRIENGAVQTAGEGTTADMDDEQLDALLGSVDIDAMIASSQAVPEAGKENQPVPSSLPQGATVGVTSQANAEPKGATGTVAGMSEKDLNDLLSGLDGDDFG